MQCFQFQQELEDALKEANQFTAEIQDLLQWLNEIDNALSMSKTVGGLPETASDQLELFMEIYHELEKNLQSVESCHKRGADYLNQSTDPAASSLQRNLETLKQCWDNQVRNRSQGGYRVPRCPTSVHRVADQCREHFERLQTRLPRQGDRRLSDRGPQIPPKGYFYSEGCDGQPR